MGVQTFTDAGCLTMVREDDLPVVVQFVPDERLTVGSPLVRAAPVDRGVVLEARLLTRQLSSSEIAAQAADLLGP